MCSTCLKPRHPLAEPRHGDLHHLGEVRSHILLCHQPGVGSWKEALSRDNGLKCPVGLSAHLPLSPGHIFQTLGSAGSQRVSGVLRPPYSGPPALTVHNHHF